MTTTRYMNEKFAGKGADYTCRKEFILKGYCLLLINRMTVVNSHREEKAKYRGIW